MNHRYRTETILAGQLHPRFRPAVAVIMLAVLGLIAPHVVRGQSTPMPPVYHPQRLKVIQPVVTEEGTVLTDPVRQADGDATFEFRVQGTSTGRHVEIVCVYPPEFEAAREACTGYHNHVMIPRAGDHVRIIGHLAWDLVHDAQDHELEIPSAIVQPGL